MKKDKEKNRTQPEQAEQIEQTPGDPPEEQKTAAEEEPVVEEQPREASVDEWREALELAVKQRDDYLDSLRRTQADFQNFKRRNQTSRADGYADGCCEVIESLLPMIDNLERALSAAQPEDPLTSGVQMTLNMMFEGLKRFGF